MAEMEEEEEEKEEAGCSRDHTAKKEGAHVSSFCDVMFMTIWRSCS
jgi:hypothetical protein